MNKDNHNISHSIIVLLLALIKSALFVSIGVICIVAGYILINPNRVFITIVFAIPLILIGGLMILINFFSFIEVTINEKVNQARCPFCNREKIS